MKLEAAFCDIKQQVKCDRMADDKALYSLFLDVAPKLKKERELLQSFINCHGHTMIISSASENMSSQKAMMDEIVQRMVNDEMRTTDASRIMCDCFWNAVHDMPNHTFWTSESGESSKSEQPPVPEKVQVNGSYNKKPNGIRPRYAAKKKLISTPLLLLLVVAAAVLIGTGVFLVSGMRSHSNSRPEETLNNASLDEVSVMEMQADVTTEQETDEVVTPEPVSPAESEPVASAEPEPTTSTEPKPTASAEPKPSEIPVDTTLTIDPIATNVYDAENAVIESYAGTMTEKNQTDTYAYTAPITGTYRIWVSDMYADDEIGLKMKDSKGYEVFSTMSYNQPGRTTQLDAGESYTILVTQSRGLNEYVLNIGVSKEPIDVSTYSAINDKMEYEDQVNRYVLTASCAGTYRIWVSDMYADDEVELKMEDSKGYEVFSTMSYNQPGRTAQLDAGETYTISVIQGTGMNDYTLNIGWPKETVDITGYSTVKDCIEYEDQVNTYSFTAPKDGKYTIAISDSSSSLEVGLRITDEKNYEVLSRMAQNNPSANATLTEGKTYTISVTQATNYGNYTLCIEGDGITLANTPLAVSNQTIWRLASSEQASEATILKEYSYDTDGNLAAVDIKGDGNGVIDDWEGEETYQWDEPEHCLLSSREESLYYNEMGQMTKVEYGSGEATTTYTYDSDGYPSESVYDDGYTHTEYYCEKRDIGNGQIQLDWYSRDEQSQGELQWYAIYQDGRMIEYHYRHLEPYDISFNYEEIELPTDQIPLYLSNTLIIPNVYA